MNNFHFDVLPKNTRNALLKFSEMLLFSSGGWYLAGGTALAVQTGHRKSVDLDFFTTEKDFNEKQAENILNEAGIWVRTSISENTLYGEFNGSKISLIAYPFFKPRESMIKFGTISMVAPIDIAVMKIAAISQRGKKRDFFDLYWLCKHIKPLDEIVARVDKQHTVKQNQTHILKSLVYFSDAEDDPDPEIFFEADWKKVKNFFKKEIPILANKLIR